MKTILKGLVVGAFLSVSLFSGAQVSVQFPVQTYGQEVQGLAFAQIISASTAAMEISLTIRVKEMGSGDVVSVKTLPFTLKPGVNIIDRRAFSGGRFNFSGSYPGNLARQSGRFPEGSYEYCYEMEVLQSKDANVQPYYEQCFVHQLQPLTPLLLIDPAEEDLLCNKRPALTWQPPMPLTADARFRVVLTEVKEKQDIAEAISFNQPLINLAEIRSNLLAYPVNIPELKEGHRYAWQVTVYSGKAILKKSEIWTFTVKCIEKKPDVIADSYRELKDADDGNFYIARSFLRFSINNPYAGGKLAYSIDCLSDADLQVKRLPELLLQPGLNKYDVDLSENSAFRDGKEYLLRVLLPNNRQLRLRFIYKN